MRGWFRGRSSCPANTRTRVRFLRTQLSAMEATCNPRAWEVRRESSGDWGVRLLDSMSFGFSNRPCFSTRNGKWLGKPGITFWILHATCRCGNTNMHTHAHVKTGTPCLAACGVDSSWHAVAFTWQSLKRRFFFYPLLIKTTALWDEVSPHCPGLSDEILKTRSEWSCRGLDLIWIWEGHRFFWAPRQVILFVDNEFFFLL